MSIRGVLFLVLGADMRLTTRSSGPINRFAIDVAA
jgi:hypothetical protein